ncbi:MAG: glycosyltransferase family 39 protein [Bacillota bacterium]|nr:glycosyltransferase family 39 protein [Bacillota bacterium]
MRAIKKHKLKISLIFALLISTFLCVYTIANYKGSNDVNQNRMGQFNFDGGGRNQFPNNGNEGGMPGGHSLDSNSQPNQNNTTPTDASGDNTGNKGMTPPNSHDGGGQGQARAPSNGGMWGGSGRTSNTNSNYAPFVMVYSLMFLSLSVGIYILYRNKKIKIDSKTAKLLILSLIGIGFLLRIVLGLSFRGFSTDISLFKNWANSAANSLSQFYSNARSSDYPPAYIYVLCLVGKLVKVSVLSKYFTLIIKLPSIIADIATAYLIYRIASKYLSQEISVLLLTFYMFNPAVFINSTLWGQVDSFFTFIVACAVFFMTEGKIALSSVIFTVGVLMKPQGIIYLPVVFFELVRRKELKTILKSAACALITAVVIILPFSINKGVTWIFQLFSGTLSEYPYASMNGFNFYSLIGKNYVNDSSTFFIFSYHVWGMIFIILITLFTWFIYIKGNDKLYASAAALIQIAGVFTFSTRMHERYLFPAAALAILAFIYLRDKRILLFVTGFSATIYLNTYAILFQSSGSVYNAIISITSLLNVVLFIYLIKIVWDIIIRKRVQMIE